MSFWDYLALGCVLLMVTASFAAAIGGLLYWSYKKISLKFKKMRLKII